MYRYVGIQKARSFSGPDTLCLEPGEELLIKGPKPSRDHAGGDMLAKTDHYNYVTLINIPNYRLRFTHDRFPYR